MMQREMDDREYEYAKLANFDVIRVKDFKRLSITDYMKHIEHLNMREREAESSKKRK